MKYIDLILERIHASRKHAERTAKRARRYEVRLKAAGRAVAYRTAENLIKGAM